MHTVIGLLIYFYGWAKIPSVSLVAPVSLMAPVSLVAPVILVTPVSLGLGGFQKAIRFNISSNLQFFV